MGQSQYQQHGSREAPIFLAEEIFWRLVVEGIVAPGMDSMNPNLPFFHVTDYGRLVLQSPEPQPYDPAGYLSQLAERVHTLDATVKSYLAESLETFRKGNHVASMVMLGIAAERVFLLLCESLKQALANASEQSAFTRLLDRFAMKPKIDWVHNKVQQIQKSNLTGFPDNATIMTVAIYDLMRGQRNELGHPREAPPHITREDA